MRQTGILKRFHDRYWPKKATKPIIEDGVNFDDARPMFEGLIIAYVAVILIFLIEIIVFRSNFRNTSNLI